MLAVVVASVFTATIALPILFGCTELLEPLEQSLGLDLRSDSTEYSDVGSMIGAYLLVTVIHTAV